MEVKVCIMVPENNIAEFLKWLDEEIHKAIANLDESWGETSEAEARLDALTEVRNRLGFLNGSQG
jgi:hypothetical protein